jgi:type I restriction enzyme R subunit
MVWLAKWILENKSGARVVIITDRDELDKQIERVFQDAGESIVRSRSGRELMEQLGIHRPDALFAGTKFGRRNVDDLMSLLKKLQPDPP